MPGSRVFISHAGPDRAWAEWVAWQLEQAGYSVELALWDWLAGESFLARMNAALDAADLVVALWSAAYFERERFTNPEWEAVFAVRDGSGPRLVPLRVEKVTPPTLLRPLLRGDVFGRDAATAREVVLGAVRATGRPDQEPPFPLSPPPPVVQGPRLPGVLPAVWNVPVRVAAFTGRDQVLVGLRDRLATGGPVVVQALHGQGGVGKTQLAVEYAHRFANAYDVVWWVDAEQSSLIGEQLAGLAVAMRLVDPAVSVPVAVAEVKRRLGTSTGWLLVLDNAEEPADLMPWLPEGPGQVLVTSRHGQWRQVASECVEVDVFAREESVTLLRRLVPTLPESDAQTISERLGDLPLAVTQAAGVLSETGITAAEYLREFDVHAAAVMDSGESISYGRSLAAALRVSVDRLAADDEGAVQLLRLCAMLAPEPIPLDLFSAAPEGVLPEPLASVVGSPMAFGRTTGRLVRYGLAKRGGAADSGSGGDGLVLHRLTQAVLRDQFKPADRPIIRAQVEAILIAAKPGDSTNPRWWPRWESLLPHLVALDPANATGHGLRWLAIEATWYVLERGDLAAGLPLAEELYRAWRTTLGDDDADTLHAAYGLARSYRERGWYERARDLNEDTLDRRRQKLGGDHPATLASANNLALDLRQIGDHEQARQLNEDTLTRRKQTLGEDDLATLDSANNLAVDLRQIGDYEQARQLDEDTLTRRKQILGEDHPATLSSANNLAVDLRRTGDYEQARQLDEDTLTRRKQILGEDHPATLNSANNLAFGLRQLGQVERADAMLMEIERLRAARKQRFPQADTSVDRTLNG